MTVRGQAQRAAEALGELADSRGRFASGAAITARVALLDLAAEAREAGRNDVERVALMHALSLVPRPDAPPLAPSDALDLCRYWEDFAPARAA